MPGSCPDDSPLPSCRCRSVRTTWSPEVSRRSRVVAALSSSAVMVMVYVVTGVTFHAVNVTVSANPQKGFRGKGRRHRLLINLPDCPDSQHATYPATGPPPCRLPRPGRIPVRAAPYAWQATAEALIACGARRGMSMKAHTLIATARQPGGVALLHLLRLTTAGTREPSFGKARSRHARRMVQSIGRT